MMLDLTIKFEQLNVDNDKRISTNSSTYDSMYSPAVLIRLKI